MWEKYVGTTEKSFAVHNYMANPKDMVDIYISDLKNGFLTGESQKVPPNLDKIILSRLQGAKLIENTSRGYVWVVVIERRCEC